MKTFSLTTHNVWSRNFASEINSDLILTQEEPICQSYLGNYKRIVNGKGGERVGVYFKRDISGVKKIKTIPEVEGCESRSAIIINLEGINVANLHLEGGGVCDKYLLYNFDNILDYKLQLLHL
jgi:hypothetical protein